MKRRRILSALLSVMLLLSLCVTSAAAAEAGGIKEVAVTMTAPQVGQALPKDAKVSSPADTVITKFRWSGDLDNGKPKQGAACSANITIEIKPDSSAVFAKRSAVSVTVNGQKASLVGYAEKKLEVIAAFYFKPAASTYTPEQAASVENYDTFDYRAYANVYPDLKAAYGYNAEKLYAHYVNFGKAEGRVGTFIGGSNPKTNAPIYGLVAGTNQIKSEGDQNSYAVVPATLLDAKPPEKSSQLDDWRLNQRTALRWMSNAKLVAEAYHTDAYMGGHWGGSLSTEAVEVWTKSAIPEELEARTTAVRDVYDYEHGIKRSGLTESAYRASLESDAYKRALCSDTQILLHCYDYRNGKSTFAVPPADPGTPGNPPAKTVGGFRDVFENSYFADAVVWAVDKKITSGTGNGMFSPDQTCTQAQILTFLWHAQGDPAPKEAVEIDGFTGTEYYYKAVQWATEQGMIEDDFNPNQSCTRAMVAVYLWKQAGSPDAPEASFTDVPAGAEYAQAVAWAVEKGITSGTGGNQFSPAQTCTRGQIATFLYRAFAA